MSAQEPDDGINWLSTAEAASGSASLLGRSIASSTRDSCPPTASVAVIRLKANEVDDFIEACRIEPGTLEHLYPDSTTETSPSEARGT